MFRVLQRYALGALAGVAASLVAFETVSVAFFAFGLYSQAVLPLGAQRALATGGFFGVYFLARGVRWRRAATLEASLFLAWYTAVTVWGAASGTLGFLSTRQAAAEVSLDVAYYAIGAALAGAATSWAVELLSGCLAPAQPLQSQAAPNPGTHRRYRL